MDAIEVRAKDRDFAVFAVPSNIDVIAERAERMFTSGRKMTFVEWYDGLLPTADFVKVLSGLTLDERIDRPFKTFAGDKLNGPGFTAYLTHLINFSVSTELGDTEADARERFNSESPKDVTYVSFTGGREDDYGHDDKIAVTRCNEFGVKQHLVVSFARDDS